MNSKIIASAWLVGTLTLGVPTVKAAKPLKVMAQAETVVKEEAVSSTPPPRARMSFKDYDHKTQQRQLKPVVQEEQQVTPKKATTPLKITTPKKVATPLKITTPNKLLVTNGGAPPDAKQGKVQKKGAVALIETPQQVSTPIDLAGKMALLRRMAATQQPVVVAPTQSALISQNAALQILRTLSTPDLQYLMRIPQQAVVNCGNGAPAHHLISAKIPNDGQREALRSWVKGGGDWQGAVKEALRERGAG